MADNHSACVLPVLPENIPQTLKAYSLWCVWRGEVEVGDTSRSGKFPCNSAGRLLKVNDQSGWMPFSAALASLRSNAQFLGIGFLLQKGGGFVGIDLDHCVEADGTIRPAAISIIQRLPGYWEKSPSGQGLHGYFRGQLPTGCATRFMVEGIRVEVYDHVRFLTVTGHRLEGSMQDVMEGQSMIDTFLKEYAPARLQDHPPGASEDWPLSKIEPILDGCAFMRHFRDDASELSEPDWYYGLSILVRCENGEALAHEWSRPYPAYTPEETASKLQQALRNSGPVTCEYVSTGLGHGGLCSSCPSRGRVRSPIALGRPGPAPSSAEGEWPEPQRLDCGLRAVPEFELGLLPANMQAYALDVSERMQVPLAFLGAALMVAIAGVAGRRCRITPKALDYEWTENGNLWGGIIASSGSMKTPLLGKIDGMLQILEEAAWRTYEIATQQYEREMATYRTREVQWKQDARRRSEAGEEIPAFEDTPPAVPRCSRCVVNDPTVAKLQELMAENPQGLLLFRDELSGWLATLDTKGRESDRPFFLECWSGSGSQIVDRIGRGTIRARSLCLSILGGIQPDVFKRYLHDAILGGSGNDGLVQRFQILVYPDIPEEWEPIDRVPDEDARSAVHDVFRRIASLDADAPFMARFDLDAQVLFNIWWTQLEHRLRRGDMSEALLAHLSKYRGLMPRIAMLCHLAEDGESKTIPLHQVVRAIDWCRFLEAHARRIYEAASPRSMASILAEKIQSGVLGQRFTVREVCKKGWSGLTETKVVRALLQELEDAGWVRPEPVQPSESGGRPAERYLVNPKIPRSR